MRRFCWIRCAETPHCSRAATKWRLNGASSRPSNKPGRSCPLPPSPTTPLDRKGRWKRTRSLRAIIADGDGYPNSARTGNVARNRIDHVNMKTLAVILLCVSHLAWAAPGKGALDKATLENYLRHVELFR